MPKRYASPFELRILRRQAGRYLNATAYSLIRRNIVMETYADLRVFGWSQRDIRIWFNNQRRLPIYAPPSEAPLLEPDVIVPTTVNQPVAGFTPHAFIQLSNPFIMAFPLTSVEQRIESLAGLVKTAFDFLLREIRMVPDHWNGFKQLAAAGAFVKLVARKNLPLSIVQESSLHELFQILNAQFEIPTVDQLRTQILIYAANISDNLTPESEGSRFIALLVDGVTRAGIVWLGIVLATRRGLHFWRIIPIADGRSATIANAISREINILRQRGFQILTIVTDNAANEKAAIDPDSATSVQALTATIVFRTACMSHSVNLTIKYCLRRCFPDRDVFEELRSIRALLPTKLRNHEFYGIEKMVETRWLSVGNFVRALGKRITKVRCYVQTHINEPEGRRVADVLDRYNWNDLLSCLEILNSLIEWTEGRAAYLCHVCERITMTIRNFNESLDRGNQYARDFKIAFIAKLQKTVDLEQIVLSFLVTRNGLRWYRSMPYSNAPYSTSPFASQTTIRELVKPLIAKFRQIFLWDDECFRASWRNYLENVSDNFGCDDMSFWLQMNSAAIPGTSFSMSPLAQLAQILIRLPCSEAGCERVFSHFKIIVGDHRHSMLPDLLNGLLMIRLHGDSRAASVLDFGSNLREIANEMRILNPQGSDPVSKVAD